MANQPTKSRKFLAGTVTAALVASAIVPTASAAGFSDTTGNTHELSINALVEAGIINGYPDGTFQPNKTLSRSDVVKLMGKWLVSLGYDVPADYATVQRFDDVSLTGNQELLKYAAVVKDNGVFLGSNGNLLPTDTITRENMAMVLVRAFDKINDTDLVAFVAGQTFEKEVTDLASAKAEARAYIDVLDYFDLTSVATFNPKATTTRGQFATFLFKTTKVEAPVTAVELSTVAVVDVNKIEVKFNTAVDTDKAVVKLTKGLANYNVTTEWNDAKDAVVITSVLSKLSPADYTVKVEGLTEEVLSSDVKVEAETASKVEVTSTQVDVVDNNKSVEVYFNVLNQYGTKYTLTSNDDLTVSTYETIAGVSFSSVEVTGSTTSLGNLKGTFTVTDLDAKLKAGDTFKVTAVYKGLTASSNVTFVNGVSLSELSFGQVLPLKDQTRITVSDKDLVVPYTAVDQYGAAYELNLNEGIKFVSSNTNVVNPSSLAVNEDGKLTVDAGDTAGTAIITAILTDGKTAQFSVTVEAEAYANAVTLGAPTTLVANGEKATLDLVVLDQFGTVIPNKDVTGLTFSNDFAINAKTGKLEGIVYENTAFKVTATRDAGTGTSAAKELASVTFAVEAEAVANTISAVNFDTTYEVGAKKVITTNDVVVKDQYGRAFTPSSVSLTEVDDNNAKFSVVDGEATAHAAGTEVVKVVVDNSSSAIKNITLTAVASADIKSYELASIGTIYNGGSDYASEPTLIGKTAAGKTVVLADNKIASLTSSNENVAVIKGLTVEGALAKNAADATSTIKAWSANGTLLGSAVVTVTNVAPKIDSIVAAETLGADVASVFTSKDQYGKPLAEEGTWYFTSTATNGATKSVTIGTKTFTNADEDSFDLATGDYTVKFVSTDGETVATTTITVNTSL